MPSLRLVSAEVIEGKRSWSIWNAMRNQRVAGFSPSICNAGGTDRAHSTGLIRFLLLWTTRAYVFHGDSRIHSAWCWLSFIFYTPGESHAFLEFRIRTSSVVVTVSSAASSGSKIEECVWDAMDWQSVKGERLQAQIANLAMCLFIFS